MERRHPPIEALSPITRAQRTGLLLGVVCLLMMPSVYRGGAEAAHAHAFLQVIVSGPDAALHHHHAGEHQADEDAHPHDHAGCIAAGLKEPDNGPPHSHDVHRGDEPTISSASGPGGTASVIVFGTGTVETYAPPHEAALLQWEGHGYATGVAVTPEFPPPKLRPVIL